MASKIPDFFNETSAPDQAASNPKVPSYFDEGPAPDTWVKPEGPSIRKQLDTVGPIFSQEFLSGLWALPSMTAETYRHLAGKLQGYGEEQALKEGREITDEERALTDKFVNFLPDLWKNFGEIAPSLAPTYQQAKKKVGEKIKAGGGELPEQPLGKIEKFASGVGKAGQVLAFPGSALVKGAALLTSGATEAADLSEGGKIGANIGVPTAIALLEAILKKKYIPAKNLKNLYEEGKSLGMTEEQLAPILATEGQVERYGPLAQGAKGTKEAFTATGEALGNVIDDLSARPSAVYGVSSSSRKHLDSETF